MILGRFFGTFPQSERANIQQLSTVFVSIIATIIKQKKKRCLIC